MIFRKRIVPLLLLLAACTLLLAFHKVDYKRKWQEAKIPKWKDLPQSIKSLPQKVGMGEWAEDANDDNNSSTASWQHRPIPVFAQGKPRPVGYKYKKVVVIARLKSDNLSWLDLYIPNVETVVYTADDVTAPLHPPSNKGHEAMVYLTYIIENYENLPDVMIFMHAHQRAWHNNEFLNYDAGEMVKRLSSQRVFREGYFNMRCEWHPGCPDWMHPGETKLDLERPEQVLIAEAWAEIFPFNDIPATIAQPCCSQFAVSKDRVLQIPKAQFEHYRNWIIRTKHPDFVSGRLWEYLFQFLFTGKPIYCPAVHVCYCDGYGLCFGGQEGYEVLQRLGENATRVQDALNEWRVAKLHIDNMLAEGKIWEADHLPKPEVGKDVELKNEIAEIYREVDKLTNEAIKRGNWAKNRAFEAGREWKDGDGF